MLELKVHNIGVKVYLVTKVEVFIMHYAHLNKCMYNILSYILIAVLLCPSPSFYPL